MPDKGLTHIGDVIRAVVPELVPGDGKAAAPVVVSEHGLKRTGRILAIRENRDAGNQRIGFMARPFILCGLPFKKPGRNVSFYRRENGDEVLEIVASPEHGLPFGMDLVVLIWVSTLAKREMDKNGGHCPRVLEFASGAEFLKAFELPIDGASYRRAQERFLRVFYSTFFYGPKRVKSRARMFRAHFFDELDLWFTKDLDTRPLPGDDFKNNRIVLSEQFAADLERYLLPIDLDTVTAWAKNPTQVYFNMWIAWRCYTAHGGEKISLLGPHGLKEQCGFDGYGGSHGARNFRLKVKELLAGAKASWPECPVQLVTDRAGTDYLLIERRATPIREAPSSHSIPTA
jgi:hypothetical protein